MSKIKVYRISNRAGTGAPEFANGIKIVGITSVGDIVGAAATFDSVKVGGTLTYEDVTNVDVLGIATYRSGVKFGVAGVGGTITADGNTTLTGIVTASSFEGDGAKLTGLPAGWNWVDGSLF